MNFTESMNAVHNRIQELEPENASKIIGYLLLMQDHGAGDMIRLAFCPDSVMRSVIDTVKNELAKTVQYYPSDHIKYSVSSQSNAQFLTFEDSMNNSEFSTRLNQCLPLRISRRSPSLPEFPVKICHYYSKGFCKHGNNCRYFHGQIVPERDSFAQMFNLSDEEHVVSPGSLERLEVEIIELLKSRRGAPISIASLPMMYYEKYGKTLQAVGYLTESQRHGKAGYSLTKLLARLKNTIRLIDRPHGQHSVILAEDVTKFGEYTGDRNEHGAIIPGSKQIYLTFPADSSFTEYDVSNYFSKFGHVEDVRIPCQQKRMFGFVTFAYAETVKHILVKGNPHFICGARVLVKPYRERSRPKSITGMRYITQYNDRDLEMSNMTLLARVSESSRTMKRAFLNEHEQQSLFDSLPNNYSFLGFSSNDYKPTTSSDVLDQKEQAERASFLMEFLSTDQDNAINMTTNYNEVDRKINFESLDNQVLNLPDSPFSSHFGKEISMAT